MLIYNTKEMKTNFMKKDELVLEIRCMVSPEQLLEMLRNGEEIPEDMITIDAFKIGEGKVVTLAEYEADEAFSENESKYGYNTVIRPDALEDLEEDYAALDAKRPDMFKAYEAFQFNRTWKDYQFERCEVTKADVLTQLYAALNIMPTIKDIPEKSVSELKKMSADGERLYWPFSDVTHDNKLPSRADIEFYQSLNDYEKRLINESTVHPMKLLDVARGIKEINKGSLFSSAVCSSVSGDTVEKAVNKARYSWITGHMEQSAANHKDIPFAYYLNDFVPDSISYINDLRSYFPIDETYAWNSKENFARVMFSERVIPQEILDTHFSSENKDALHLRRKLVTEYDRIFREVFLPKFTRVNEQGEEEISFTEEDLRSFAKKQYQMPMPRCIKIADEKFKELFRGHSPKVLFDYMYAQLAARGIRPSMATEEEISDIVSKFNQKNVSMVAKYRSPILFALADKLNYNEIKEDHIQALAVYIGFADIKRYIDKGFVEWYQANKDVSISNLVELLQTENKISKFTAGKTAKELVTEVLLGRAIRDCRAMEEKYGYRFEDNEIAIRGRHVVAKEGKLKMYMLPADDYRNFTVGHDTHCCQVYGNAGESCVWKYTTDPFAACVVIEREGKILAQGFVWTDEAQDTLVFDNVEFADDRKVSQFTSIFAAWAKEMPYKNIHVGTGYNQQMRAWGKSVTYGAVIPTTLDGRTSDWGRHIYTDYRESDARSIKTNGVMQIAEKTPVKVSTKPDEPTKWDDLARPETAFLLNDWRTPIEERLEFARDFLHEQTPEVQMEAVKKNPYAISYIENPTEEVQMYVVRQNAKHASLIKNPCFQVQAMLLEKDPEYIRSIANPTEEMQKIAVRHNGLLLKHIENPSPVVIRLAVEQNGYAVRFVDNPTEDVQLAAIRSTPKVVSLIRNPSERVVRQAIHCDASVIGLIDRPAPHLQVEAVEIDPNVISSIKNPDYSAVKRAIEKNGLLIRSFQYQYPHLRDVAIEQNPYALRAISNPTEEEYVKAVRLNPAVANIIRDPGLRRAVVEMANRNGSHEDMDFDR